MSEDSARQVRVDFCGLRRLNTVVSSVEADLGGSTARLYAELGKIVELASTADGGARTGRLAESRLALARISLSILCGVYHDLRSGSPTPKGDLVEALRAVPSHRAIDGEVAELVARVLRGDFTDEVPARHDRALQLPPRQRDTTPEPIELSPREWRPFVWLYRYVEVYGQAPTIQEMADGLETKPLAVVGVLRVLERKGAVTHIGGRRGWLPLREP